MLYNFVLGDQPGIPSQLMEGTNKGKQKGNRFKELLILAHAHEGS